MFSSLDELEPLACPMDLGLPPDVRLAAVAAECRVAMERRLLDVERLPPRGDDFRLALLGWCRDLDASVRRHGCAAAVAARLSIPDRQRGGAMLAWSQGRWSTRPALIELCWRLEQDPHVTTAGVLLFDRGGGTEEQRPFAG